MRGLKVPSRRKNKRKKYTKAVINMEDLRTTEEIFGEDFETWFKRTWEKEYERIRKEEGGENVSRV